jgi:hypothetical protein
LGTLENPFAFPRRATLLASLLFTLAAQAQVVVSAPDNLILRAGDSCPLQAGVASAAALDWHWSVPPGDGTVVSAGDGRAVYTAPFVLKPTAIRVRAAVATDPGAFAEVALTIHPHPALQKVEELFGSFLGPRTEPLVESVAGQAAEAKLGYPEGLLFVDQPEAGLARCWLFADGDACTIKAVNENGRVRVLTAPPEGKGQVGYGSPASVGRIFNLAVLPASATRPFQILFTEAGSNAIRSLDAQGRLGVFAGLFGPRGAFQDGPRLEARFHWPRAMVVDSVGNVYVADTQNGRIRKIAADGQVTTLFQLDDADAEAWGLGCMALDEARGALYVQRGHGLYRVSLEGKAALLVGGVAKPGSLAVVEDLAPEPGPARLAGLACFGTITDLRLFRGLLFIADMANSQILSLDPDTGDLRHLVGCGIPDGTSVTSVTSVTCGELKNVALSYPARLAFDDQGVGCIGGRDRLALLYFDESVAGPKWGAPVAARTEAKGESKGESKTS